MKRTPMLLALALALAATGAHAEIVWKWNGPDGKPVYGKQAPPGVRAEQVEVMTTKPGAFAKANTTVDLSKLPNAPKPPAPGAEPVTPYCPPNVSACQKDQKKLGKGDLPMTPPIPEAPPERDKNGNVLK